MHCQVTLEEEDPTLFAIFLTWILAGTFKQSTELIKIDHDNAIATLTQQYTQLHSLYILGDRLLAEPFRNAVMDAQRQELRREIPHAPMERRIDSACIR